MKIETIPTTGFASLNPKRDVAMILMSFIISDTISLSTFSVLNLIKGVQEIAPATMIKSEVAILMSKLFTSVVETPKEDNCKIDVSRDDVAMLRTWLESRMKHCEDEKERYNQEKRGWLDGRVGYNIEPTTNFNADTYIGMKLLLIELREWLLGEERPTIKKSSSYANKD